MKRNPDDLWTSGTSQVIGRLQQRLGDVGLTPKRLQAALVWFGRGGLLGIVVYLANTPEAEFNLRLNLIIYIAAMVWSYYDGIFARRRWSLAWIEALVLCLVARQIARLLTALFESYLIAAGNG